MNAIKYALLIFCIASPLGFGCASKKKMDPNFSPPTQLTVEVIIAAGSDPVSPWLIRNVIRRTTGFCNSKGGTLVRVTLDHYAKRQHTNVSYRCDYGKTEL